MSDFVGSPPQEWDFSPNLFVGRVVGGGVIILSLRIIFELSFALDSQTMSSHLCVAGSSVVGRTRGRGAPATVFCQIGRAFGDLVVVVGARVVAVVVVCWILSWLPNTWDCSLNLLSG